MYPISNSQRIQSQSQGLCLHSSKLAFYWNDSKLYILCYDTGEGPGISHTLSYLLISLVLIGKIFPSYFLMNIKFGLNARNW